MFQSRHRRFIEPARIAPAGEGIVELTAPVGVPGATPVRITQEDLALARLFDGSRDAVAILELARSQLGREVDRDRLEGLAAELGIAGLLQAGTHEPLPVPAQSDDEARLLGWIGPGSALPQVPADTAMPPSTVPGSRYSPGFLGGLMGLVSGRRGTPNRISVALPLAPFVGIGALLIWPLATRARMTIFLLLFLVAMIAVAGQRLDWVRQGEAVLDSGLWPLHLLLAAVLANLCVAAARAATLARYTPERPVVGLLLPRPFGIPRLFVDTAGAAERARRVDRLRVIGSGLLGIAALVVLSVLLWFGFGQTLPGLGRQAVATTAVGVVLLVLRLNPLALFEGHYLLAHRLGHPDLRNQAWSALFKIDRPWPVSTKRISRGTLLLYAALVIAFLIFTLVLMFVFLGDWLMRRFGGLGFLLFTGALLTVLVVQHRRGGDVRNRLGRPKPPPWKPTRKTWIGAGVALLIALLPYHYEPGGPFVVLPGERADVLALVEGDVREILAREGDQVEAGQVILRLDDARLRAELAAAQATLARLEADLALVRIGLRSEAVEVARERWITTERMARVAAEESQRAAVAFRGRDINAFEHDQARGAADLATQAALVARRAFELASSPAQDERIAASESLVAQARVDVDYRRQRLRDAEVRAPIAGELVGSRLRFARGEVLDRGALVAQVQQRDRLLAEVALAESDAVRLKVDGEATLRPWAYAGRSVDARVRSIAPGAEQTTDGRVTRVQLEISGADPARLLSGMTGEAKIDAGWQPLIVVFTRAVLRFVFVRAWSWIP